MSITTSFDRIQTTLYTITYVDGYSIDVDAECPECSDEDAYVVMNLYVREWGQTTRFVECCVNCGKRIALSERPAEILIEVPASIRDQVQLTNH